MKPNPSYCTAPWVETHLYHDGQTRLCDHNQESFGNWQQAGLPSVWGGEGYRQVRRQMMRGEFPNEQCRACSLNQTTSKLSNHVLRHFGPVADQLQRALGKKIPELEATTRMLEKNSFPENWAEVLAGLFRVCAELKADPDAAEKSHALEHLVLLGEIAEDFLLGKEEPRHVGPSRQVRLINKCNARCVMCAGKFNGDIVNGPGMPEEFVAKTLEPVSDVISYASEASEFLLFRKWREIAEKLSEHGLPKLRVYTNGILANKENVRFLLDRGVLETFHFSLNGATKETIESGQVNVKYDQLVENVRNFFDYAEQVGSEFLLTFSFVIMRRNYREMPQLLRLVQELRGKNRKLRPLIYFAFLETNNEMDNYREFLFQEHHSLVPEAELRAAFVEAEKLGREFEIPVRLFETELKDFLAAGQEPPRLVCKERDVRLLVKGLKLGTVGEACLRAVQGTTPAIEKLLAKLRNGEVAAVEAALAVRDLLLEEKADVRVEGFDVIERSEANRWRWALGERQSVEFTAHEGPNEISYRLFVPQGGTQLVLKVEGTAPVSVQPGLRTEVAGKLAFHSADRRKVRLEIEASPRPEMKTGGDSRPLAYSVYSFAHSRGN